MIASSLLSYSYVLTILLEGSPVDRDLSREEYINKCVDVSPADYFRSPDQYTDKYVTMTLSVSERFYDATYYYASSDYYVFYICTNPENPEFQVMIRDCMEKGSKNFIPGDTVVIYGECTGELYNSLDLNGKTHSAPLINVAYYEILPANEDENNGEEGDNNGNAEGDNGNNAEGDGGNNTEGDSGNNAEGDNGNNAEGDGGNKTEGDGGNNAEGDGTENNSSQQ